MLEVGRRDLAKHAALKCYRPALSWLKQYAEERLGLIWTASALSLAAAAVSVFQFCSLFPVDTCTDQCRGHLQDTVPFGGLLGGSAFLLLPMLHLRYIKGRHLG